MKTCGKLILIGELFFVIFLAVMVLIFVTRPSSDSEDSQDGQSK